MTDVQAQFETQDLLGTTTHFNGSVDTTADAVPSSAGAVIAEVLVACPQQSSSRKLFVSFDGGTTFKTLEVGEFLIWSPKGGLTQIHVKGNVASVDYEIIMNREPA